MLRSGALAMLFVAACSCGPDAPTVPPVDPSREEPSRETFLGFQFVTYFERNAGTTSPLIVALHGRGETPQDFAPVWREFPAQVEIALPPGPLPYGGGRQWFDWPPGMTDDALAEAVDAAEAKLWPAIAALARGRQIILAGVGQGAVLTYAMANRHPDEIACGFAIGGPLPVSALPHGTAPVYALDGADGDTISPAMRDELITQVRAVAANLARYPRRDPDASADRWNQP